MTIAEQSATTSPDAMAQDLIAEYGRDSALQLALEADQCGDPAFWADVATLIRLETQSDEA